MNSAPNVGPEFFQHTGYRVPTHHRGPRLDGVRKLSVTGGMIRIGNCRRHPAARYLRNIKCHPARIFARDRDPAHSITRAPPECSFAILIVTAILLRSRSANTLD